jgi:hypothetical protein
MSLVGEALRKARARTGDGAAGAPTVPPTLVLPPRRYRPGIGVVPLAMVAVAAAVGGAAGVWWAVGRQRSQPSAAAAPAPAATAAPLASAPAPGAGAPAGAPLGSAPAAARDAGTPGGASPHSAAPAGGDGRTDAGAIPDSAAADAPAAGTVRPPEPGAGQSGGESTARGERRTRDALIDADLGYAKLHLDYLVYRPGSPFGRVNGQDVIVGSTVEGFRVDEITADHIKLSDRRTIVVLRVR